MTNEEIIEFFQALALEYFKDNITKEELISTSLELARADERAKMQGVDVWISWDSSNRISNPYLSDTKPIAIEKKFGIYYDVEEGSQIYGFNPDLAANYLGVKPGECAKFKIVRYE